MMGYLYTYWKRYRIRFLAAVFFLSLEALSDLMQPALMARIVDRGVADDNLSVVEKYGWMMLAVTLFGAGCACMRNVLSVYVSQRFAMDLRQDLYTKIQRMSLAGINHFGHATLITRLTNDVTRVQTFVNGMMRIMMKAPLAGIGSLIIAVHLNARLSLILLAMVPVVGFLIYMNMRISYPYFRRVQEALDRVNSSLQDYLSGVRVVKIFNRENFEKHRFQISNRELGQMSSAAAKVGAFFSPLVSLSVNVGIIAIIWIGGLGVNAGSMQLGSIIAFTNYMTQILFAIMIVNNAFSLFVRARASAERIGDIMSEQDRMTFPVTVQEPDHKENGSLEFRHVSFSYRKTAAHPETFLNDIHFSIRPGETVGITGPIASGKTTLTQLLLRFYDPDSGEVRLNGMKVRRFSEKQLREKIALVPQQPLLFTGTIKENIRWGNAEAVDDDIFRAARLAEAEEFILRTPGGYDSLIGEGGVNFSGGQKQRLSIARALIRRPDILILDDATSAVDAHTERLIRENLRRAGAGLTCLIISQRIASIIHADKIIVMDQGRIEAIGTHRELLNRSAYYRAALALQLGVEVNDHG